MYTKLITGAVAAAIMLPSLAAAQSSDTQTQIQSLLSQIQALQLQLKTLLASVASSSRPMIQGDHMVPGQIGKVMCLEIGRNLRMGSQGDDVRAIQEVLREDRESGFNADATGFFGPLTARALAKFQVRMGIASSTDGVVGPLTRGFFQRQCGYGLVDDDVERIKAAGTIAASSASSVTIKTSEDSSKTFAITASTTIYVFASATSTPAVGSASDLAVGKRAVATGLKNTDGTLTAHRIDVGEMLPVPKMLRFDIRGKKLMERFENR